MKEVLNGRDEGGKEGKKERKKAPREVSVFNLISHSAEVFFFIIVLLVCPYRSSSFMICWRIKRLGIFFSFFFLGGTSALCWRERGHMKALSEFITIIITLKFLK